MATESPSPVMPAARRFTGWCIVAAILFILLGMFAIIEPTLAGLAVAILVGWLLIFGGIGYFIAAFDGGAIRRVLFQIFSGIVYLVGGLFLITHPLIGLGTLTLILAGMIIAAGILDIVAYFRHRGEETLIWMLLNGIVAILLGGLIWFHWPSSSVWAIGILVGINLLMTGFSRLMLGLAGRKLINRAMA